ncbi:hypothetical protein [Montanilutibacter psychrotolerans]|uniref:hypothetical protein n=1 Tax=Montanilutibacter psychrotolerans TaxID=1327343 RepID=UPI00167FF440|nr:hypothetical protein [Lysobacter psychrotolerans]
MTPFVLKQHEKDRAELKEMKSIDVDQVSGGRVMDHKLNTNTWTITCSGEDGADDGCDD